MNTNKQAFTLIETLVVIAIIMLLVSLLFPAASRIRQNSLRVKDASNLRQIGTAAQLYAGENEGRMVPYFDYQKKLNGQTTYVWQYYLKEYMDGYKDMNVTEFMSAVVEPNSVFNAPGRKIQTNGRAYGLNPQVSNANWDNYINRVPNHAAIVHFGPMEASNTEWMASSDGVPTWAAPMAFRYGDLTNFLYVDGHVGLKSAEEMTFVDSKGNSPYRWW